MRTDNNDNSVVDQLPTGAASMCNRREARSTRTDEQSPPPLTESDALSRGSPVYGVDLDTLKPSHSRSVHVKGYKQCTLCSLCAAWKLSCAGHRRVGTSGRMSFSMRSVGVKKGSSILSLISKVETMT